AAEAGVVQRADHDPDLALNVPDSLADDDVATEGNVAAHAGAVGKLGFVLQVEIEPVAAELLDRDGPVEVFAEHLLEPGGGPRLAGEQAGVEDDGVVRHAHAVAKAARAEAREGEEPAGECVIAGHLADAVLLDRGG